MSTSLGPRSSTLWLTNDVSGDTTVLVDDFTIHPSTNGWSYAPWTDDADSGVDSSKTYTHAYNFGGNAAPDTTINGVLFKGVVGANPVVANEFWIAGLGSAYGSDEANNINTGGSAAMARRFIYGGNPGYFSVANLVPGMEYVATFYSAAWEDGMRAQTFAYGNDRLTVNQDHFGNNNGVRISYRYTAPANGAITLLQSPTLPANTHHLYGFANCEANPQPMPVVGLQPRSQVSTPGSTATFSVTAGGSRPLSFQWFKGDTELSGQTSRFLTLSNLTAGDLGGYSVVVSNPNGSVTSQVATLTFGQIANPSFEADVFQTWPGYVNGNTPISGWNASNPGRAGVNPLPDYPGPFANNGAVPDGSQVGFLQSTGTNWLSTSIDGLTPGQKYTLTFRANARNGQKPTVRAAIDGEQVAEFRAGPVDGTNSYREIAFDFTPATASPVLYLTNDAAGDHTVLLDEVRLAPSITQWSYAAWNDDASSGVDGTKAYSHAYNFGGAGLAVDTTINGVRFLGVPGANPALIDQFATTNFTGVYGADVNNIVATGGGSALLGQSFIYYAGTIPAGALQTITLPNLVPGVQYEATIYGVAFDAKSYARSATFAAGTDKQTISEDAFDNDNGIRVVYRYVADQSGSITLTHAPNERTSSFHTYGFSNHELNSTTPPHIYRQPLGQTVPGGTTIVLDCLVGGQGPIFLQWQKDGMDLQDQTNLVLTLADVSGADTGDYTLIVSNVLGVVTSEVAAVRVGLPIPELFSTGVDDSGALLAGGAIDPHYELISSADPAYPGPAALVLYDVWPVSSGVYMANGPFSSWISPRTNDSAGNLPGLYAYRTAFILDTLDPATAQIRGKWAMDNAGIDIQLNGVSLGISNNAGFASFGLFTLNSGFVPGSNTLDFVISNAPPAGPTALRVELSGVAMPLPPTPPLIVSHPQSQLVQELDNVLFVALATGSSPLTYQWYFEGFDLQGETNRTLRLPQVFQFDQQGRYWVVAHNSEGEATSDAAVLTINAAPVAGTDQFATATDQSVAVPQWKLLVNDSDSDGDAISLSGVDSSSFAGGTIALVGDNLVYTPPAGLAGQDEFSYTLQDARGGRATGGVVVLVGETNFISVVSMPQVLANDHVRIGYQGIPGYPYVVEWAPEITGPWNTLTNVVAGPGGLFEVEDSAVPRPAMRFYRATYP